MSASVVSARRAELARLSHSELISHILHLEFGAAAATATAGPVAAEQQVDGGENNQTNTNAAAPPTDTSPLTPTPLAPRVGLKHSPSPTTLAVESAARAQKRRKPDENDKEEQIMSKEETNDGETTAVSSYAGVSWSRPASIPSNSATGSATATAATPKPKSKKSAFDFSHHHFRHVALKVMYFGTDYLGFALQPTAAGRSIEGEMLRALEMTKLIPTREAARITRCGRTDKGVHSSGQVIGVYVRSRLTRGLGVEAKFAPDAADSQHRARIEAKEKMIDENEGDQLWDRQGYLRAHDEKDSMCMRCGVPGIGFENDADCTNHQPELDYVRMLNGVLPDDIRVVSWQPVPSAFSARFSCTSRTYRYFFFSDGMDLDRMRRAALELVGSHDFRNFAKVDPTLNTHFVRFIKSIQVKEASQVPEDCVQITSTWPCTQQQWMDQENELTKADTNTTDLETTSSSPSAPASSSPAPSSPPASSSSSSRLHPDTLCELIIHGNAFLYHQVRCMAGILFLAGRGVEAPDLVARLLDVERTPNKPNYDMAPESPLVLYDTFFPALPFTPGFDYQAKPATEPNRRKALGAEDDTTMTQTADSNTNTAVAAASSSPPSTSPPAAPHTTTLATGTDTGAGVSLCLYPDARTCARNGELVFSHLHHLWRKLAMSAKVHELFLNQAARNLQAIKNQANIFAHTFGNKNNNATGTNGKKANGVPSSAYTPPCLDSNVAISSNPPRCFAPLLVATAHCRGLGLKPLSSLQGGSSCPVPYSSIFSRPCEKSYDEKVAGLKGKKRERHQIVKEMTHKFRKATSYEPKLNKILDNTHNNSSANHTTTIAQTSPSNDPTHPPDSMQIDEPQS